MIDKNKKYTTQGGHPVIIYAIYPNQKDAVHGAYLKKSGFWQGFSWAMDGREANYITGYMTLIEVKND